MAELLTADGLAQAHKIATSHVGDDRVPGLVALVARGDQVHAEVLGSRAIGGPAMQRDSLFRIASLTKPVTGVATLVLAAEGRLRLATVGPPDLASQPDPDTWIAGLGSLPLLAQPGERWFYNTSASVLGVLCARAAGQPFAEVLRSRIFEPLSMPDTGFWTTEPVG